MRILVSVHFAADSQLERIEADVFAYACSWRNPLWRFFAFQFVISRSRGRFDHILIAPGQAIGSVIDLIAVSTPGQ
jgi:hypothetical protein